MGPRLRQDGLEHRVLRGHGRAEGDPGRPGTVAPRRLGHPRAVSERAHLRDGADPNNRSSSRASPCSSTRTRSDTTTRPAMHQPDNVETTANSVLIHEDPAGTTRAPSTATPRCGGSRCPPGRSSRSRRWISRCGPISRPARGSRAGSSTPRRRSGPGAFLVDVQAHGFELETAPTPSRGSRRCVKPGRSCC